MSNAKNAALVANQALLDSQRKMRENELVRLQQSVVDNQYQLESQKAKALNDLQNALNNQLTNLYNNNTHYQIGQWYNGRQWDGNRFGKLGEIIVNGAGGGGNVYISPNGGLGSQINVPYITRTSSTKGTSLSLTEMEKLLGSMKPSDNQPEEDIEPLKRMLEEVVDE